MQNKIPSMDVLDFIKKFSPNSFSDMHLSFKQIHYQSGNISLYELFVICLLERAFAPKRVLEIGTFNGRTTLNLASNILSEFMNAYEAAPRIFTVDYPTNKDKSKSALPLEDGTLNKGVDELGFIGLKKKVYSDYSLYNELIHQVWEDSALLTPKHFPEIEHDFWFNFAFVDGSHSYEYAKSDANFVFKHLKMDGMSLAIFHDYGGGWVGVTKALDEIYENVFHKETMVRIEGTSFVVRVI